VPKHNVLKICRGNEVKLQTLLTSALRGGKSSASNSGRFIPAETVSDTQWTGCWMVSAALFIVSY